MLFADGVLQIVVPFMGLWTKDVFLIDRNNPTFYELAKMTEVNRRGGILSLSTRANESNHLFLFEQRVKSHFLIVF